MALTGRLRAGYRAVRTTVVPALAGRPDGSGGTRTDVPPVPFRVPRRRTPGAHLALVMGHFTFDDWYATFGDTEAMRVVVGWLERAGIAYDVACHPANGYAGVDLACVDPAQYTIAIFVCGPWTPYDQSVFLDRFAHCTTIGVNVSIVDPSADRFDHVWPRDAGGRSAPDVVFSSMPAPSGPVAGVFMVHEQPEYGLQQRHSRVAECVDAYFAGSPTVRVPLDTLYVGNTTSARDTAQLDALLRRLDFVITSRLHGFVLALRAGVPAIALDPIAGGGKVTAQARSVEWPYVIGCEALTAERLASVVDECLAGGSGAAVERSVSLARSAVSAIEEEFVRRVADLPAPALW